MAPEVKTIREWLSPLGLEAIEVNAGLDLEALVGAPKFYSTPGTGALQVDCGGLVILGMPMYAIDSKGRLYAIRHTAMVVVDDAAGRRWDADRRREGQGKWNEPPPRRPWSVLRLVISA